MFIIAINIFENTILLKILWNQMKVSFEKFKTEQHVLPISENLQVSKLFHHFLTYIAKSSI